MFDGGLVIFIQRLLVLFLVNVLRFRNPNVGLLQGEHLLFRNTVIKFLHKFAFYKEHEICLFGKIEKETISAPGFPRSATANLSKFDGISRNKW
jgi:hypothetical protein